MKRTRSFTTPECAVNFGAESKMKMNCRQRVDETIGELAQVFRMAVGRIGARASSLTNIVHLIEFQLLLLSGSVCNPW